MPFSNHGRFALCVRHDRSTWQVHFDFDNSVRLDTGIPDGCVECAPTFYIANDTIYVSYVAGGHPTNRDLRPYNLYQRKFDLDLNPLTPPALFARTAAGFVAPWGYGRLKYPNPNTARVEIVIDGQVTTLETQGKVYRVSYHPERERTLLISGANDTEEFAVRYDLLTDTQEKVIADGLPAYKFAEYGDSLWYARRIGTGFEDREIIQATTIESTSTTLFTRLIDFR